jgi:prepilin peptidase CpaA
LLVDQMGVVSVFEYPLVFVFPAAMAFAGAMDLFTMTIPNRISLVLIGVFFALAAINGLPLEKVALHVAAGLTVLVIGFVMFSKGWMGGGDAKLLASTALWLGFEHLLPYLVWASLLGGALGLFLLTYRSLLPPRWALKHHWALHLHNKATGMPYGIALAGAALIIYPTTTWYAVLGA